METVDIIFDIFTIIAGTIIIVLMLFVLPIGTDATIDTVVKSSSEELRFHTAGMSFINDFNKNGYPKKSSNFVLLSTYYSLGNEDDYNFDEDEWNYTWSEDPVNKSKHEEIIRYELENHSISTYTLNYPEGGSNHIQIFENLRSEGFEAGAGDNSGFRLPIPTSKSDSIKTVWINPENPRSSLAPLDYDGPDSCVSDGHYFFAIDAGNDNTPPQCYEDKVDIEIICNLQEREIDGETYLEKVGENRYRCKRDLGQ